MKKLEQYVQNIVSDLPMTEEEKRDLQEEFSVHLEEHVRELMVQGLSEDEAVEQAIAAFGHENKINWELKKTVFPIYKLGRFVWSVSFVTAFLCIISYSVMEYYHPEFDNALSWESIIGAYFIVFVIAGAVEGIYEGLMDQFNWRWLSNPWLVFLPPAVLIGVIQYTKLLENPGNYQQGFWIELFVIPISTVLYLLARELFDRVLPRSKQRLKGNKAV